MSVCGEFVVEERVVGVVPWACGQEIRGFILMLLECLGQKSGSWGFG